MCDNNWELFEFSKFSLEKLEKCDRKSEKSINTIRLLHKTFWHLKYIWCDFGRFDFEIGVSMWVQRCINKLFFLQISIRTTLSFFVVYYIWKALELICDVCRSDRIGFTPRLSQCVYAGASINMQDRTRWAVSYTCRVACLF